MKIAHAIYSLLKETLDGWSQANGTLLAAALAYYTIFSLAPLLVIAVNVAGAVFGPPAVTGLLVEEISHLVSPSVAAAIQRVIENIYLAPSGDLATIISLAIMLIGASILFVQLKRAINFLWGIVPQQGKGLIITLQTHFLSFVMVLVIGLLVLAAMALGTILVFFNELVNAVLPDLGAPLPRGDFILMFLVFTLLFAIIFKVLPDARIVWQDALLGAAATSLLFTIGEFLIGYYLGRANLGNAYGTAGSIVLILIWVYYSMQIVLFGAKLTQVYADKYGSKVLPSNRTELFVRQRINSQEQER
ncbi:MAG: YihY/virulence factor BrkB family protein [Anaerolineales bacterium]|nr:YihY/virulence factor BrkB family protein [Anaerolineales bacterium]